MSDENINVKIGASIGELVEGMRHAGEAVEGASLQMKGALAGINAAFETAMAPLIAFTAILQGGKFLGEAINATVDMTKEAGKLGRQLGISANDAGALAIAINKVHGTTEGYGAAANMLTRQIRSNEDGVKAMGVQTRNADGSLRNMQDIMLSAIDTLKGYKEGTDRNLAAQTLFGRGAANLGPILKMTSEVMEEAKKKQEELGLTITKEGQERVTKYRDAMTEAKEVMEAVKVAIGNAVLPAFTALGEWFANNGVVIVNTFKGAMQLLGTVIDFVASIIRMLGKAASDVFGVIKSALEDAFGQSSVQKALTFANVMKAIQIAFLGLKVVIQVAIDVIQGFAEGTVATIQQWANTVTRLLALDLSGANAVWDKGFQKIADAAARTAARVKQHVGEMGVDLVKIVTSHPEKEHAASDKPSAGGKGYKPADDTDKKAKTKALMDGLEHELAAEKQSDLEKSVLTNQNHQMTIAGEAAFWASKLKEQTKGSEAYNAIQKKYDAAHLSDLAQRFQREQALGQELLAGQQAQALAAVNQRQALADRDVQLGITTNARKLAQDRQFEAQRYQIEANAITQRMALLKADPNSDPAAYAKLLDQKLALDAAYQAKVTQMATAQAVEANKYKTQAINSLTQSWGSAMQNLISGQATFANTLKSMWQGVIGSISQMFAKMFEDWLAQKLRSLILSKAMDAKAGAANVRVAAGEAAAGAYKATVGIPYVGPFLAPAAAATAYAATLAFTPSAAGGYDIPSGVNPMTQLHQREMVLPAQYADVIRSMAGGNGGAKGVQIHINALDARQIGNWLDNGGGDQIVKHLQRANRNFQGAR